LISAKNGINIEAVLESVVKNVPPPEGDENAPLRALIFDSYYDSYKGVIVYIRVKEGTLKLGDKVRMMYTNKEFTVTEIGYMKPGGLVPGTQLSAGEVGYFAASIKNVKDTRVEIPLQRPTIRKRAAARLQESKSYGILRNLSCRRFQIRDLRDALEKLQLNDASLTFEPESSVALGFGFRCGFLGLLHMEIIQERLEREFDFDLVTTAPSVIYKVTKTNGETLYIDNPTNLPPRLK